MTKKPCEWYTLSYCYFLFQQIVEAVSGAMYNLAGHLQIQIKQLTVISLKSSPITSFTSQDWCCVHSHSEEMKLYVYIYRCMYIQTLHSRLKKRKKMVHRYIVRIYVVNWFSKRPLFMWRVIWNKMCLYDFFQILCRDV